MMRGRSLAIVSVKCAQVSLASRPEFRKNCEWHNKSPGSISGLIRRRRRLSAQFTDASIHITHPIQLHWQPTWRGRRTSAKWSAKLHGKNSLLNAAAICATDEKGSPSAFPACRLSGPVRIFPICRIRREIHLLLALCRCLRRARATNGWTDLIQFDRFTVYQDGNNDKANAYNKCGRELESEEEVRSHRADNDGDCLGKAADDVVGILDGDRHE
mmetsp:Transcript_20137/g.55280  ORF Transcript_20137/g.55280 Transcript_20137/m.55280 type:complete len:215 (+) Transcript_20137:172-816(+)